MNKTFSVFFYGLTLLILSACGGGGSSSGGSPAPAASQTPAPPATPPSVDGTYTGTWTATLSFPERADIAPETSNFGLTIVISGSTVEVSETGTDTFTAVGQLSATNGFSATSGQGVDFSSGSVRCSGEFTFAGAVVEQEINGRSRSLFNCNVSGIIAQLLIEGPYTVNRTSNKAFATSSINDFVLDYISN